MEQALDFLTEDYSAEVTQKIPELCAPARKDVSQLPDCLEKLLLLEKKTRLAADQKSTVMLASAILKLIKDCGKWAELNEHILLLCKRRAQLKKAIQTVVQDGMTFIADTPDKACKLALIDTLRTVSAGKMYVELERARMTRQLADMKEADGMVEEAADLMQDLTVETIGSMEQREKLEFILEQMRLCLAKKDYIRSEIIAKKVTEKQLNDKELQDLRLKYYRLMIEMHTHKDEFLLICRAYDAMYHTKSVQDDEAAWREALTKAVVFSILSPFDSDVSALYQRFKADVKIEQLPACQAVLEAFTTSELCRWPLPSQQAFLDGLPEFKQGAVKQTQLMEALHKRVVQHNLRVVSGYYKRITSQRLAELLQLDADKMEVLLSEMVSSKQLYAKIDRCVGTVTFEKPVSPEQTLNGWAGDISSLLTLVDETCHLIQKENMVRGLN